MSVQIVSEKHINAILSYALAANFRCYFQGHSYELTLSNYQEAGQRVLNANVRSYNERYEKNVALYFNPQRSRQIYSNIQIVKLCHALAYQCTEKPLWNGSLEKAFLEQLAKYALQRMPEYQDAEWTI